MAESIYCSTNEKIYMYICCVCTCTQAKHQMGAHMRSTQVENMLAQQ